MQNYFADERRKEFDISLQQLLQKEELDKLQREFCKVIGVCAFCTDAKGVRQTDLSGSEECCKKIRDSITDTEIEDLLSRVRDGSLEDQAVQPLGCIGMQVAAISVKVEGKSILNWVLFDCGIEEERFYEALNLLRVGCEVLLDNKVSRLSAEAETRRSRFSEAEMGQSLQRVAAMSEIVQLLDNDEIIEKIMDKFLQIVGKYLSVTYAYVFQVSSEKQEMDVNAWWWKEGAVSIFEKTKGILVPKLFYTDSPRVISGNSLQASELRELFQHSGMKAMMLFPVLKNDTQRMYVGVFEKEFSRIWKAEEVKFISDAVKILQNVLTRRIQKNSIASSYASLEAILDNVGSLVYVKDKETGKPLFANRKLKNLFGKELQEHRFDTLINQETENEKEKGSYEIYIEDRKEWFEILFTEILWVDGRKATLCSLYDITDRKIYQKRIEQQAYTDFLTGLYNRMCCERDLSFCVDTASKNGTSGALLYLDLDDFKHINDGLGHQYGDVLLKAISHSLQRIRGIEKNCYRMGGDEFVIIIPPKEYPEFDRILKSIKDIFNKPWFLKNADYYCTMSMGIVNFPNEGEEVQELIKKADLAMYESKKSGKNRVTKYTDNINSVSGRRLDMEKNMRDATITNCHEFEVYFQPIIDISLPGNPCTGAEALIRWNSAVLGFIPPADFIPLAEYLGLINPIGNHVLYEACKTCKNWNENGHPDYKVNVNLSVIQLLQANILETIQNTLCETKLNPHNLTLEVTESLAINDMDKMKEILNNIKALGVRIALDDFGTGYSSLNHIREIPFDVIKVDQSFVKDLTEAAYTQSFIKMVAELAETIGVSICVEGIETEEQYKVLEGMKVRMVQGYYFDRPMIRREFEKKYVEV